MALVNNGVKVSVPSNELPSGYTKPIVSDQFTDYENSYISRTMTIVKSTVENATDSTTVSNLVTQLNTDIETLINADFDTTGNTVTIWSNLRVISNNDSLTGVYYTNGALNYLCLVDIFIKTS